MRSTRADPASRRARRLTGATVVAVAGCLVAGGFEFTRAVAGNTLSWVYAVEWPLFAVYAIYMRHRLMTDTRAEQLGSTRAPTTPADTDVGSSTGGDPQLVAWQEYLDRLHSASPPGGPPPNEQES